MNNNFTYKKGGKTKGNDFTDNVNQWVMHSYNWETGSDGKPKFFEAFGDKDTSLRNHLYSKWKDYYNREGSGGVMNRFWTELSKNNQEKLADWIKVNYTSYAKGGLLMYDEIDRIDDVSDIHNRYVVLSDGRMKFTPITKDSEILEIIKKAKIPSGKKEEVRKYLNFEEISSVDEEGNTYAKGGKVDRWDELHDLIWTGAKCDEEECTVLVPQKYTLEEVEEQLERFNDNNNEWWIADEIEESDDGKHWVLESFNDEFCKRRRS